MSRQRPTMAATARSTSKPGIVRRTSAGWPASTDRRSLCGCDSPRVLERQLILAGRQLQLAGGVQVVGLAAGSRRQRDVRPRLGVDDDRRRRDDRRLVGIGRSRVDHDRRVRIRIRLRRRLVEEVPEAGDEEQHGSGGAAEDRRRQRTAGLALGDAGLGHPLGRAFRRRRRGARDLGLTLRDQRGQLRPLRIETLRLFQEPEGIGRPLRLARLGDQRADLLVALARLPRGLGGLLLLGLLLRDARLRLGDPGEHRLDARRLRIDLRGRVGALARLGEVAGGEPALGLGELGGEIAGAALGGLVRRLRVANLARQLLQRRVGRDRGASPR